MRLGPYELSGEGFRTLWRMRATRRNLARGGHVRHEGPPLDVARAILRANAGEVHGSGGCHYRAMWVADTGKAFAGALDVLPRATLETYVDRIVRETAARGHVPVCVTPTRAHDIPWRRADGLPWLLHMAEALGATFATRHEEALRAAYDAWREAVLDASGAVSARTRGDWMDTVRRPSSTYNNLCALRAHAIAARWSWPGAAGRRDALSSWLHRERWRGDHFAEDASGSDAYAADAQVHALYLPDLPIEARRTIADGLVKRRMARPIPVRSREPRRSPRELPLMSRMAESYHDAVWTHLGWMYCIGLERVGLPWQDDARILEASVRREGTFLETLMQDGAPFASRALATERDFTMSAGLYVELGGTESRPTTSV